MKKSLFLIIPLISFVLLSFNVVNAQTHVRSVDLVGFSPLPQNLSFVYEKQKKYSSSIEIYQNTTVKVGYVELEIVEVQVMEGRKSLKVTPLRTGTPRGSITSYSVMGHSQGGFTLSFADADDDNDIDPYEGQQKKRDLKMTVIVE